MTYHIRIGFWNHNPVFLIPFVRFGISAQMTSKVMKTLKYGGNINCWHIAVKLLLLLLLGPKFWAKPIWIRIFFYEGLQFSCIRLPNLILSHLERLCPLYTSIQYLNLLFSQWVRFTGRRNSVNFKFYSTPPNILLGGISVGWPLWTWNGWDGSHLSPFCTFRLTLVRQIFNQFPFLSL